MLLPFLCAIFGVYYLMYSYAKQHLWAVRVVMLTAGVVHDVMI